MLHTTLAAPQTFGIVATARFVGVPQSSVTKQAGRVVAVPTMALTGSIAAASVQESLSEPHEVICRHCLDLPGGSVSLVAESALPEH